MAELSKELEEKAARLRELEGMVGVSLEDLRKLDETDYREIRRVIRERMGANKSDKGIPKFGPPIRPEARNP